jgi:phosphate transport system protein
VEATFLVRASIDAYMDADESLGAALDDVDDRLDDLHVSYIEAIFSSHQSDNLPLQAAVQLAMIGRYYERIGDHAVNIGERVRYMVTGWLPEQSGAAVLTLREGINSSSVGSRGSEPTVLGAVGPPGAQSEPEDTDSDSADRP